MNGNIKNFDDGGKNMSFVTDDEDIYEKYNEIWEVVRKLLKLKFTVGPVRDDKYIIAKLKIFNKINRTTMDIALMNGDAIIPTRASKRSAGLDLYSSSDINIEVGSIKKNKYWNTRISSRKFLWIY